jgi:steroid 5-alpha reductase family enzyme
MMGFHADTFATALAGSLGAILLLLAITLAVALHAGRHNVIDTTWGLGFAAVALVAFIASRDTGDGLRRWLLLLCPVIWGCRLAYYTGRRALGKGEDPRYDQLLDKGAPGGRHGAARTWRAIRIIYALQGFLVLFIALPLIVGASTNGPVHVVGWVGVAVWALGMYFESVGDAQMSRFKGDPANKGKIMDRGLWRFTRHPNYFGDACIWAGMFLLAAERWPGVLTILSPVAMILLLTKGSGAANLERHMAERPGYAEYMARTSGFVPRPPRHGI